MTENILAAEYVAAGHSWFDPWKGAEVTCEYRFRRASKSELARFQKEVGKSSSAAQHNLVTAVIHPDDQARYLADAETYPGLQGTFAAWALKNSGFSDLGN